MRGLKPGYRLADKYRIVKRIGRGSAGAVYRAVQENVNREVAIKVLSVDMAERAEMIERFRREAYNISRLKHPNTVTLFDYGSVDEFYYIVMEMLEGQTLGRMLRVGGPLLPSRAVHILGQLLRSLKEAHELEIVHRDLKPDNIFIADILGEKDFVKVLDFGIAKALGRDDEVQLTEHGMVFGTPSYMAPEQATGTSLAASTDVYAAGLIFYEMLSGQMAFQADSMYALLNKQVYEPVPKLEGDLAMGPYNDLIGRATTKQGERRYQDAGVFLDALREAFRWMEPNAERPRERPTMVAERVPTSIVSMTEALRSEELDALGNPTAMLSVSTEAGRREESSTALGTLFEGPSVFQAVPFEGRPPQRPRSRIPMLGRDDVLEALDRLVWDVLGGRGGRMAMVTGEPGVGKTCLMEAFCQPLGDEGRLRVTIGIEGQHQVPCSGIFSAIRASKDSAHDPEGELGRAMEQWLHQSLGPGQPLFTFFSQLSDLDTELPDASRLPPAMVEMLFGCVGQLLGALGRDKPLLLCLDDAHLIDEWTVHLLHYLTQSPCFQSGALSFLLALRARAPFGRPEVSEALSSIGWSLGDAFVLVPLAPFERPQLDALLRRAAPISDTLCESIWSMTRGNPGQALDTLCAACDGPEAAWRAGQWEQVAPLKPPAELEDMIREHLSAMTPPQPAAAALFEISLQWAAVLGERVPRSVFDAALRRDPRVKDRRVVFEVRDGLIDVGLITTDPKGDGLTFELAMAAALMRDDFEAEPDNDPLHLVAYEAKKMMTWHDAIERDLQLGHHLDRCSKPERALEHFLDAADTARRTSRTEVALSASKKAVELLEALGVDEDDHRLLIAQTTLAELILRQGAHLDAIERLRRVQARATSRARHRHISLRARHLQGLALFHCGDLRGAREALGELLKEDARTIDSPELIEFVWTLGLASVALDDGEAREICRERLDNLRDHTHKGIQAAARLGLGLMKRAESANTEAITCLEEAARLLGDEPRSWVRMRALLSLGHMALERIEPESARACLVEAAECARCLSAAPERAEARVALARLELDRGALNRAEKHLRTAWSIAEELNLPWRKADVLTAASELRAMEGDLESAEALLAAAVGGIRALGADERRDPHWRHAIGRASGRL